MDVDDEFNYSDDYNFDENQEQDSKQNIDLSQENKNQNQNEEEEIIEEDIDINNENDNEEEEEEVFILNEEQKYTEEGNKLIDKDIIEHARYLGFDIENDLDLLFIAEKSLITPLPNKWNRVFLKKQNRICYLNEETQSFNQYSPNDELAIEEYKKAKILKNQSKNKQSPTNIIENDKYKSQQNNQVLNEDEKNNSNLSEKLSQTENFKIKQFLDTEKSIENKKYDIMLEEKKNQEKENLRNLKNHYLKEKKAEFDLFRFKLEKEYEKADNNYILEKEKRDNQYKEYYENKLKEKLKQLEALSNSENEKNNLDGNYQNDYQTMEEKIQAEFKKQLNQEEELIQLKIRELKKDKNEYLTELEVIEEAHERANNLNDFQNSSLEQLTNARELLEEKFILNLKFIEKKYKILNNELEYEEESKFSEIKENLQNEVNQFVDSKFKSLNDLYNRGLEDYSRSLENEYVNITKSLVNKHENTNLDQIREFRNEIEKENEEKEIFYKTEINQLENLYYKNIAEIRQEFKHQRNIQENYVLNGFYNRLFREVHSYTSNIIEKITNEFKNLVSNIENQSDESNIDQFMNQTLFNYTINNERNKINYQNTVIEYKNSFWTLDYYYELGIELTRFLKNKLNTIFLNEPLIKEKVYYEISEFISNQTDTIKEKVVQIFSEENLILNFDKSFISIKENDERISIQVNKSISQGSIKKNENFSSSQNKFQEW